VPETTKLLVVDDDVLVLEVTAEILRGEGYEVLVAESADEALSLLAADNAVALVVTDVLMPRKDGFALALEARQMYPSLPFILVTAYSRAPDLDGSIGAVLRKPFRAQQLVELVARTLAK
jgi:CheY-like chemotaxis protein